jgi:hypothetical protein
MNPIMKQHLLKKVLEVTKIPYVPCLMTGGVCASAREILELKIDGHTVELMPQEIRDLFFRWEEFDYGVMVLSYKITHDSGIYHHSCTEHEIKQRRLVQMFWQLINKHLDRIRLSNK